MLKREVKEVLKGLRKKEYGLLKGSKVESEIEKWLLENSKGYKNLGDIDDFDESIEFGWVIKCDDGLLNILVEESSILIIEGRRIIDIIS